MSTRTSSFFITEHVIPCQYLREYPRATKSDDAPLRLAVKEYRPRNYNACLAVESVTIIAAHGNGFPKEAYEPLFEDMCQALKGKIEGIWIADCAHQGASGVLNEDILGDDPNWFDHSRDLLCMVNHFRDDMSRPIIGIGHSLGAAQLVRLSLIHPRLFHSLALIEPVIQLEGPSGPNAALFSTLRPDAWASRSEAEASFRKSKAFKNWDPRALDQYLRYGLRELPPSSGATGPATPSPPATLTTSKHQESWTYVRSNFTSQPDSRLARLVAPDLSSEHAKRLFHRPEMALTFMNLPSVRPNVLWLFGARSTINTPEEARAENLTRTGTGIGGSGGFEAGRVESVTIDKGSHMLPFENVHECARVLAPWIEKQIRDFRSVEEFLREHDSQKSSQGMRTVSKLWEEKIRLPPDTNRRDPSKL